MSIDFVAPVFELFDNPSYIRINKLASDKELVLPISNCFNYTLFF